MDWPTAPVDLAEAARLFTRADRPVDRSNLSRYVVSRNFPTTKEGRRTLVDAKALFDQWSNDFTRLIMSGTTDAGDPSPPAATPTSHEVRSGDAGGQSDSPSPSAAGAPVKPSDPKRRETELKVLERELDLAKRLGQLVPVEEVSASMAEAIAELRSALAGAVQDQADILLTELGLPSSRIGIVRAGLKRFANLGQVKFAESMARLLTEAHEPASAGAARLEELVEVALQLRADAAEKVKA